MINLSPLRGQHSGIAVMLTSYSPSSSANCKDMNETGMKGNRRTGMKLRWKNYLGSNSNTPRHRFFLKEVAAENPRRSAES